MLKNFKIDRNYFYHLILFIFIYLFLSVLDVALLNKLFFSIAYFWHTLLRHPNIQVKVESKRYRYSFIRYIFVMDCYLQNTLNKNKNIYLVMILRACPVFGFVLALYFIGDMGNPFYSIVGSVVFEAVAIGAQKIPFKWPPDQSA